jgi:hypothetical protein
LYNLFIDKTYKAIKNKSIAANCKVLENGVNMKVIKETGLEEFEAWSGAVDTKDKIIEAGKAEEFDAYIEDLYPDGIDETALNDILWFEEDQLLEELGITEEDEEEEPDKEKSEEE